MSIEGLNVLKLGFVTESKKVVLPALVRLS